MARELVAQQAVLGIGRHAADEIPGLHVFDVDGDFPLLEIGRNPVAQEWADILVQLVAGSVKGLGAGWQQILPRPLGQDDDGMAAGLDAAVQDA